MVYRLVVTKEVTSPPEGPEGARRAPKGPAGPRKGPQGPEGARRTPKGPAGPRRGPKGPEGAVGTDVPKGFKLNPIEQNSTGSDIGHVTSS